MDNRIFFVLLLLSVVISSSSSSATTLPRNHDVFLSFRGEDTRIGFTSHLHYALDRKGIKTFIDVELRRGEQISPSLLEAIEKSKMSIIVFSKNFASSTWCLDEVVKIIECKKSKGQMVRPVFYGVEPGEVRKQVGSFAEAFAKHEETFRDNIEKVHTWKVALNQTANLSGWHLKKWTEAEFILKIVEEVLTKLNHTSSNVTEYPVGLRQNIFRELSFFVRHDSRDELTLPFFFFPPRISNGRQELDKHNTTKGQTAKGKGKGKKRDFCGSPLNKKETTFDPTTPASSLRLDG